MSNDNLLVEDVRGSVTWLRLNRPARLNALNKELCKQIEASFNFHAQRDDTRVVVLAANGRAFCAGADLTVLLADLDSQSEARPDLIDCIFAALESLRRFPKPIVAALNGHTVAGGLELAMCCDVLFASEDAQIADGHAAYGMFPGGGGAAILARRIGLNRAKAMLFGGDSLPARVLVDWGLIHAVVPTDQLDSVVSSYAQKLACGSPRVLEQMKSIANATVDADAFIHLRSELLALRDHMRSEDFREGLAGFKERRRPIFSGR